MLKEFTGLSLLRNIKNFGLSIFNSGSFKFTYTDLFAIKGSLEIILLELSAIETAFRSLADIVSNKFKNNNELVDFLLKSNNSQVKELINTLIKLINSTNEGKTIYREKGLLYCLQHSISAWININEVVENDLYIMLDKLKNNESVSYSDFTIGDLITINILSLNPFALVWYKNIFAVISGLLGNEDIDNYKAFLNILTTKSNLFSADIICTLTFDKTIYEYSFTKELEQKGLNVKLISSNVFDMLRLKDFSRRILLLLRLTPNSKGFFVNDIIMWYTLQEIDDLKETKQWLEQKLVSLKMELENINEDSKEYDKISRAIEYYENKLIKINKKLDNIYG